MKNITLAVLTTIASVVALANPASADIYIKNKYEGTLVNKGVTDLHMDTIRVGYEKDGFFAEVGGGVAFAGGETEGLVAGAVGYETDLTDNISLLGELDVKYITVDNGPVILEPVVEIKYTFN